MWIKYMHKLGIYSSMHDKNKNGKYINESINKILDELCKIMNVDKILEIDDNKILNKLRRIIFDNCKNNEIDIDKYCQMFQYFMKGYNYYSMYPNIDIVNNYINKKLLKIGNKISLL